MPTHQHLPDNIEGNLQDDGYCIFRSFFDRQVMDTIYSALREKEALVSAKLNQMLEQGWSGKGLAVEKGTIKYLKNPNQWFPELNFLLHSELFKKASEVIEISFHLSDFELHQKSLEHQKHHPTRIIFILDWICRQISPVQRTWHLTTKQKNKGVSVFGGSHKVNLPHHRSDTVGFSSGISDMDLERFKIYNPVFQPGDVVFHHCNIVHAAVKNSTEETRSNVALRLFPQNQYTTKIYEENMKSSIIYLNASGNLNYEILCRGL